MRFAIAVEVVVHLAHGVFEDLILHTARVAVVRKYHGIAFHHLAVDAVLQPQPRILALFFIIAISISFASAVARCATYS